MDRIKRKKLIKTLIRDKQIGSQQELLDELKHHNLELTQATLSRDINELGIKKIKTQTGFKYVLDEDKLIINTCVLLNYEVLDVAHNEIGIFIKTLPGRASGVADLVDKISSDLILTTLAGDNSIFIVPKTITDIPIIREKIESFIDNMEHLNRKKVIKNLIKQHQIESQNELLALLKEQNIEITQATLSRDMRELGIKKIHIKESNLNYYALDKKELILNTMALIHYEIIDILSNEIGVFIKTLPGRANGVAELIDTLEDPLILTTLAGDDTIFIVPKTTREIQIIKEKIEFYIDGTSTK